MKPIEAAKKILGEDIFDQIKKSDVGAIYKPESGTAVAMQELQMALQIVPRAVLSYLMSNLKDLEKGHSLQLKLPFADATLEVTKIGADTYNGTIHSKGKIQNEFNYRTIPAIGVIIMTTFELYDLKDLPVQDESKKDDIDKLQKLIDERLYLRNLISMVLEEKLSQKEAIERFMSQKIGSMFHILPPKIEEEQEEEQEEMEQSELSEDEDNQGELSEDEVEEIKVDIKKDKKSKLKEFLESRKEHTKKVEIKKEELVCGDCGSKIEKTEKAIKPCICFGALIDSPVKIKKSEGSVYTVKFPKEFDSENINMFIRILKKQ
jgi:hypothetical protein